MLQALLLSRDHDLVQTFRRALETVSINLDTATEAEQTLSMLAVRKYDALIVDCDDVHRGAEVVEKLRGGKSNRKAIAFVVTNGSTSVKQAYDVGANFVIDKPVTLERANKTLRAAHGLILRERSRYYRHEVNGTATLSYGPVQNQQATLLNVSESGLGLRCAPDPRMSGVAMVSFNLPGARRSIEARAQFVKSTSGNHVGLAFVSMAPPVKEAFDDWLARQAEMASPVFINATSRR